MRNHGFLAWPNISPQAVQVVPERVGAITPGGDRRWRPADWLNAHPQRLEGHAGGPTQPLRGQNQGPWRHLAADGAGIAAAAFCWRCLV